MEHSVHGIPLPDAAAGKVQLQMQNRDAGDPWSVGYPYPSKPKRIELPWLGFGVADGKEAIILQAMMKRKRDASVGHMGDEGGQNGRDVVVGFEAAYLRHDGHFCCEKDRKKTPVRTFVKQYRRKSRKRIDEIYGQGAIEDSNAREYSPAAKLSAIEDTRMTLPMCGVNCYQVRAKIYQKAEDLMAHEPGLDKRGLTDFTIGIVFLTFHSCPCKTFSPEKLEIKARMRPKGPDMLGPLPPLQLDLPAYTVNAICTVQSTSASGNQGQDDRQVFSAPNGSEPASTGHQGVQTVFTENKMVQTTSSGPKQVQWAILPRHSLSPKLARRVTPFHNFASDQVADDAAFGYREAVSSTGRDESVLRDDPLSFETAKSTRGKHHLLLYREAMEKVQEHRDLERAREQRQDFWSVYEQELKKGKGSNMVEVETEKKGKKTAEDDISFPDSPVETLSAPAEVKIQLNAFLDEHLSIDSTSPLSSSPRDGIGSSDDDEAIVQQLLDQVESFNVEASSKDKRPLGLQGLRKMGVGDSLQSLELMEQQLNPETSKPQPQASAGVHLSPTELDCMKAAILSHNFYPRLVASFISQHKIGAPPDQVERLEKIQSQVMESWRPSGIPVIKPAHKEKIKKYQKILTRFERELEKPFQDSMDFSWQMEHYLGTIPPSGRKLEGGASSGSTFLKDFGDEFDDEDDREKSP